MVVLIEVTNFPEIFINPKMLSEHLKILLGTCV
jgi:hypothetical protein